MFSARARRGLTVALLVFVLGAVAAFVALRRFRLPAPTGRYAVGTTILNFTDASRSEDGSVGNGSRSLVVQLWYPAAPSQGSYAHYTRWKETSLASSYEALLHTNSRWNAPLAASGQAFPLLILGPRWAGQRTQQTGLAEDLASHGYVVAAVDHPYNASRVLLGDGRVIRGNQQLEGPKGEAATAEERIAYWNQQLDVWAADDIFVINQLAAKNENLVDAWHGKLDTDHVGAVGHSFGGAASLRLCGLDPRIKAAVNFDGWTFAALHDRTAQQSVLMLYEHVALERETQLQTQPLPGTTEDQLDRADMAAVNESFRKYGGEELFVAGTQHLDFSDQPLMPPLRRGSYTGPIAPLRIEAIMRASVLDFFDTTLRGRPAALLGHSQQVFPEVTDRQYSPAAKRQQ